MIVGQKVKITVKYISVESRSYEKQDSSTEKTQTYIIP